MAAAAAGVAVEADLWCAASPPPCIVQHVERLREANSQVMAGMTTNTSPTLMAKASKGLALQSKTV